MFQEITARIARGVTHFTFVKVKAHVEMMDGDVPVNAGNVAADHHAKVAALEPDGKVAPPQEMVATVFALWLPHEEVEGVGESGQLEDGGGAEPLPGFRRGEAQRWCGHQRQNARKAACCAGAEEGASRCDVHGGLLDARWVPAWWCGGAADPLRVGGVSSADDSRNAA